MSKMNTNPNSEPCRLISVTSSITPNQNEIDFNLLYDLMACIDWLADTLKPPETTIHFSGLSHPAVLAINIMTWVAMVVGGTVISHLVSVAIERANYDILMYKTWQFLVVYVAAFHMIHAGGVCIWYACQCVLHSV